MTEPSNVEQSLSEAEKAIKVCRFVAWDAMARCGIAPHNRSLYYDDVIGAALTGYFEPQAETDNGRARRAGWRAKTYIFEQIFRVKSHHTDSDEPFPLIVSLPENIPTRSIESYLISKEDDTDRLEFIYSAAELILSVMQETRTQKVGRAATAAIRDTNILLLLLQGESNEGIAREIELPTSHIRKYISDARKRITQYLENLED